MSVHELFYEVDRMVEKFIDGLEGASPIQLGLDYRAGGIGLMINQECIVVPSGQDRTMQYYGGFEYVDKRDRREFGPYVIYTAEFNSRVQECIDRFYGIEREEEEFEHEVD